MPLGKYTVNPPEMRGSLHITPTGQPSSRASAVMTDPPWWRPISKALGQFPRDAFDYVWLITPPAYDPALVRDLTPVWRDDTSTLFRVNREDRPAGTE